MQFDVEHKDGVTVVSPKGAITSTTCAEFENALAGEPDGTSGIIIDADELEYISSAGLRVILSAKKRCKDKVFKIVNVSTEVKSVFDITGFSEIMDITLKPRHISVEGCKKIGAGACGECYRIDDETIIKLYYPHISRKEIELEKELAKKAFVMGVPTAISYDIVECDGRDGVIYELINSKTLCELIREDEKNIDAYIDLYADVCRQIHSIDSADADLPSFKDINRIDIAKITDITEEEREYLYKFIDIVPDYNNCVHGDLNINNIMVQNGECCLIDMGEFSTGFYLFDISRILFSMHYAGAKPDEVNTFYKLPQKTVDYILDKMLCKYFDCDNIDEAISKNDDLRWLHPLAWFRCAASMLKGNRWSEEKKQMAHTLLGKLIEFIDEETGKN